MPSVQPPAKVLVTGASGFIAAWVVKALLEEGYAVRGTVRSKSKGDYLVNVFKNLGFGDRFEYVIVEDIATEGAFDEAVKGVDAIEHTASPFHFRADDPQELIVPAVNGTKGILSSALKHAPSVKRVLITSSMASILEPTSTPRVFTEKDWNNVSLKEVEEKGKDALPIHKYRTSKTLAEKVAWQFVQENDAKFDLVSLNPPFVLGPLLHDVPTPTSLNTSIIGTYAMMKGKKEPDAAPGGNWVDVRDLANAHVKAVSVPEAGGERFIVGVGPYTFQDILDAIHASPQIKDDPALASTIARGRPGASQGVMHPALIDNSKVKELLGLEFRSMTQCAGDMARSLLEKERQYGWS